MTGRFVTLQMKQQDATVKEMIVLTSECLAENNKESSIIFGLFSKFLIALKERIAEKIMR